MQPTTERMTRSRARTLAATGQTPALGALPDKTPATTRTTRRRAAAAAAAPAETEGGVAPVVLFDVTNEQQTGSPAQPPLTARDAPAAAQKAAAPAAPEPEQAAPPEPAKYEAADEPAVPASPAPAATAAEEPAVPASPAPAAAAAEEPAVPASPAMAAEEQAVEEPPATPASAPTSPAPPVPGATPTGLGLSSLPPLSPSPPLAFQFQAATPAATPLAGLHDDHQTKVADALAAAVEALGGASPAAAASPAPTAGLGGEPMFRGFGSPLKQEEGESPALLPPAAAVSAGPCVSIGAAIGAVDGRMADDAMSSPAPEVGLEAAFELELTLEEMMGTPPGSSDRDDTPAAAAAAGATPGVLIRTAANAHPLTPARQVVLEEEEQDYIMETEEGAESETAPTAAAAAVAPAPSPAPTPSTAPAVQPSPAPSTAPGLSPAVLYLAPSAAASPAPALAAAAPAPSPEAAPAAEAAEVAAQGQPRIGSKVVMPSPGTYDPRSLRQLKKEVADRLAAKQAAAPGLFAEDEEEEEGDGEYIGTPSGDDLAEELGALSLEGGNKLLRGLPTPAGTHIRFGEEGEVEAVSPRQRVYLRGVPQPSGMHIKFDD